MSTNVYALKRNLYTDELFNSYKKAAQDKNIELIKEINEKLKEDEKENTIHIGKRSGGWKFLFNHNNWKYYDYTQKSINEFLQSCYKLENEYGDEISIEQFWKEYVEDFSKGFNGKKYCENEIKRAYDKINGKINDPYNFIMTPSQAESHYYDAKNKNWYEEEYCEYNGKKIKIPYNKINYRFSYSTEFC